MLQYLDYQNDKPYIQCNEKRKRKMEMWQVLIYNFDDEVWELWGEYEIQEEAIQVRNDLLADKCDAKIKWMDKWTAKQSTILYLIGWQTRMIQIWSQSASQWNTSGEPVTWTGNLCLAVRRDFTEECADETSMQLWQLRVSDGQSWSRLDLANRHRNRFLRRNRNRNNLEGLTSCNDVSKVKPVTVKSVSTTRNETCYIRCNSTHRRKGLDIEERQHLVIITACYPSVVHSVTLLDWWSVVYMTLFVGVTLNVMCWLLL